MQKVLIIGAGEIGQAIAKILTKANRCAVDFWDSEHGKVPNQKELKELTTNAGVVFLAIPSKAVRPVLNEISSALGRNVPVVVLAKGLEESTGKTMDQVLRECLGRKRGMLLYGPMIAEEISAGKGTAAVLAAYSASMARRVIALFECHDLRLTYSKDIRGVALTGVLKNIYSVGLGIADGLALGSNFGGWFVAQACLEMSEIVPKLGGKRKTVYGQSGVGDLVATGFSSESRNHQTGFNLAKDPSSEMKSEGTKALPQICNRLGGSSRYPLLNVLRLVVVERKAVSEYFPAAICACGTTDAKQMVCEELG
jgi:glycerol-3-phosphate dehydrogenase